MINRDVETRECAFGVEVSARKIEIAMALRNWRANSQGNAVAITYLSMTLA
jgi:hypothetical protein